MIALFIGRFQPLHKGHAKIIQNISKKYDEIIIGIGSSQYSNTQKNPFSSKERIKMIEKTLTSLNIDKYRIELIPDIHNPPKWVDHVLSIVSDFDVVISNSDFTKQLFIEKGYSVEGTPVYDREHLSGEEIRRRIRGCEKWEHLVPDPVVDIIKDVEGEERIKNL